MHIIRLAMSNKGIPFSKGWRFGATFLPRYGIMVGRSSAGTWNDTSGNLVTKFFFRELKRDHDGFVGHYIVGQFVVTILRASDHLVSKIKMGIA